MSLFAILGHGDARTRLPKRHRGDKQSVCLIWLRTPIGDVSMNRRPVAIITRPWQERISECPLPLMTHDSHYGVQNRSISSLTIGIKTVDIVRCKDPYKLLEAVRVEH